MKVAQNEHNFETVSKKKRKIFQSVAFIQRLTLYYINHIMAKFNPNKKANKPEGFVQLLRSKQKLLLVFLFTVLFYASRSPTLINSVQVYASDLISNFLPTTPLPEIPIVLDMSPKAVIDRAVEDNKVVVFSKSYCPYCKKAKALLASLNANAKVYELDQMDEGADWQAYLGDKTGQRTVPSIFINGEFIGGSSDLEAKNNSGDLVKLLK